MRQLQNRHLVAVLATVSTSTARLIKPAPAVAQPLPHITPPPDLSISPRALGLRQVTDDPDPQTRDDFQGWYQNGTTNVPRLCAGNSTWTVNGDFARCCDLGSSCAPGLMCTSPTLIIAGDGTKTCLEDFPCSTVTIYDEWPNIGPKVDFLCVNNLWTIWTMFRQISTTESLSTTGDSSPSSSPTDPAGPPRSSNTSAWIAGAVIGPLAIIAIIAGVVFFFIRRREKADRAGAAAPGANNYVMHEDSVNYKPHGPPGIYDPNLGYQGQAYMAEADSKPLEQRDLALELPTEQTGLAQEVPTNEPGLRRQWS